MTSSRKECRDGAAPCAPVSEREALYCQVNHAALTRHELADAMAINPSTLSAWGDPNSDRNIPSDRLEQVLRLTKEHAVYLRYLASLQGQAIYAIPEGAQTEEAAELILEFGNMLKSIAARADGTTTDEAAEVARRGTDLISLIAGQIEAAARAAAIPPSSNGPLRIVGGQK